MRHRREIFTIIAWVGLIVVGINTSFTDGVFGVFWKDLLYYFGVLAVGTAIVLGLWLSIQRLLNLSMAPFIGLFVLIVIAVAAVYHCWLEDIVLRVLHTTS